MQCFCFLLCELKEKLLACFVDSTAVSPSFTSWFQNNFILQVSVKVDNMKIAFVSVKRVLLEVCHVAGYSHHRLPASLKKVTGFTIKSTQFHLLQRKLLSIITQTTKIDYVLPNN